MFDPSQDDYYWVNQNIKDGGNIQVFARYALGNGAKKWLRIEYGFSFMIDGGSDPQVEVYAQAHGGVLGTNSTNAGIIKSDTLSFTHVTGQAEKNTESTEKTVATLLAKVIAEALNPSNSLFPQQTGALKLLQASLRS